MGRAREGAESFLVDHTNATFTSVAAFIINYGWCIAATGWRGLNPFIFVRIIGRWIGGWKSCVSEMVMQSWSRKHPPKFWGEETTKLLLLRRNQYRLCIGMHSYLVSWFWNGGKEKSERNGGKKKSERNGGREEEKWAKWREGKVPKWYEWWKLLETLMKLSFAHIILALLLLHISLRKRESIMSPKLWYRVCSIICRYSSSLKLIDFRASERSARGKKRLLMVRKGV